MCYLFTSNDKLHKRVSIHRAAICNIVNFLQDSHRVNDVQFHSLQKIQFKPMNDHTYLSSEALNATISITSSRTWNS